MLEYYLALKNPESYWWKITGILWLFSHQYIIPNGIILPNPEKSFISNQWDKLWETLRFPLILRSSINCEDSQKASFAWVFHSEVVYSKNNIDGAVQNIVDSSKSEVAQMYAEKMGSKIEAVHILVQEFIEWELSWVFFSNLFDRGPIVEYVIWPCSDLVEGKVNANRLWKSELWAEHHTFPVILGELFQQAEAIQEEYGMEVDIEWTIMQNKIYFLQIRPISDGMK